MALLKVSVTGGSDFAGYLSVNGSKERMIVDGGIYEIPSGIVHFDYNTRSSAERKTGQLNAAVNGGSMIGAAMSAASIGESFSIDENITDNMIVELNTFVKGNRKVYAAPVINAIEVSPEVMQAEMDDYNKRLAVALDEAKAAKKKKLILGLIIGGGMLLLSLAAQFIR